jgi:hypothetical protein
MHLNYRSYGPYAANNKQATSAAQIMAGEMNAAGNGWCKKLLTIFANFIFIFIFNIKFSARDNYYLIFYL